MSPVLPNTHPRPNAADMFTAHAARSDFAHERRLAWQAIVRAARCRRAGAFQRILMLGPGALEPARTLVGEGAEIDLHLDASTDNSPGEGTIAQLAGQGVCRTLVGQLDPAALDREAYDLLLAVDPDSDPLTPALSKLGPALRDGCQLICASVRRPVDLRDLETTFDRLLLRSLTFDHAMPNLVRQCPSIACARLRQAERRFLARLPGERGRLMITLILGHRRPSLTRNIQAA